MKQKLFTKSAFKVALTCPRSLYYYYNSDVYANQEKDDEFLQSLAEGGFQVGELAKVYYGISGRNDIKSLDYDESQRITQELMQADDVNIAEAAFRYGDCFVRVDILEKNVYSMVGFRVANTLSENGKVSRGVCSVNEKKHLTTVVERTEILRKENGVCYKDGEDWVQIADNTPVSMNVWGFTPEYFQYSEDYFKSWLKANIDTPKSEYYIPLMVNELINSGKATCEVLDTTSKWFGVTYADDRQGTVDRIARLVKDGVYPSPLF